MTYLDWSKEALHNSRKIIDAQALDEAGNLSRCSKRKATQSSLSLLAHHIVRPKLAIL